MCSVLSRICRVQRKETRRVSQKEPALNKHVQRSWFSRRRLQRSFTCLLPPPPSWIAQLFSLSYTSLWRCPSSPFTSIACIELKTSAFARRGWPPQGHPPSHRPPYVSCWHCKCCLGLCSRVMSIFSFTYNSSRGSPPFPSCRMAIGDLKRWQSGLIDSKSAM